MLTLIKALLYHIYIIIHYFGIPPPLFMKGCIIISSKVGLLEVSSCKILEINYLADSEMITCSGKEY